MEGITLFTPGMGKNAGWQKPFENQTLRGGKISTFSSRYLRNRDRGRR
jgi:hypothetical protein